MIRSKNDLVFEDGYGWLVGFSGSTPRVATYVDELIELLRTEKDPSCRARFVELLGCTQNEKAIPILKSELSSPIRMIRDMAIFGLDELNFPEAIEIAKTFREQHPEEG